MIGSFRNKHTENFVNGRTIRKWEPFRRQAEKRLRWLESANTLADLAAIQSNRLEKLRGDRAGQYSIRINDQWRICFHWSDEGKAEDVEICDYH
jgi:proteic killer suppression protein